MSTRGETGTDAVRVPGSDFCLSFRLSSSASSSPNSIGTIHASLAGVVAASRRDSERASGRFAVSRGEVSRWASISAMNWDTREVRSNRFPQGDTKRLRGLFPSEPVHSTLHSPLSRFPVSLYTRSDRSRVAAANASSRGVKTATVREGVEAGTACVAITVSGSSFVSGGRWSSSAAGAGWVARMGSSRGLSGTRASPSRPSRDPEPEGCVGDSRSGPSRAERASARRWRGVFPEGSAETRAERDAGISVRGDRGTPRRGEDRRASPPPEEVLARLARLVEGYPMFPRSDPSRVCALRDVKRQRAPVAVSPSTVHRPLARPRNVTLLKLAGHSRRSPGRNVYRYVILVSQNHSTIFGTRAAHDSLTIV